MSMTIETCLHSTSESFGRLHLRSDLQRDLCQDSAERRGGRVCCGGVLKQPSLYGRLLGFIWIYWGFIEHPPVELDLNLDFIVLLAGFLRNPAPVDRRLIPISGLDHKG